MRQLPAATPSRRVVLAAALLASTMLVHPALAQDVAERRVTLDQQTAVALAIYNDDLALVREVLGRPAGAGGPPTLQRIIEEVCDHFQLSQDEIASGRRTARLAVPRQLAMYLCRHHTDTSLHRIGEALGGRDHSTVVHALSAIEKRLQKDAGFRRDVTKLRARLRA